jgi:hypothetical protein
MGSVVLSVCGGVVNDVADHCPINLSRKTRPAPPTCMRDCTWQTSMIRHACISPN